MIGSAADISAHSETAEDARLHKNLATFAALFASVFVQFAIRLDKPTVTLQPVPSQADFQCAFGNGEQQ
jgi:hypothetical protein